MTTERIWFGGALAIDPVLGQLAKSAPIDFFLMEDVSRLSPLPAYNELESSVPHIVSSALGFFPRWALDVPVGVVQVQWASASFSGVVTSDNAMAKHINDFTAAYTAQNALMASLASANEALAAASGIPAGGLPGQAVIYGTSGALAAGAPAMTAAGVTFVPPSGGPETVQDALTQLLTAGPGGGSSLSSVLVLAWTGTAWPALPTTVPAADVVLLVGPSTAPAPSGFPSWAGFGAGKRPVLTFLAGS